MRKTKKALASLAIAGMVLSIAPMSVLGATATTRLAGNDRIQTAIAVAGNGWTTADNVIVVPADDANIVDALAAAPLAGQLNAPILVTYKGALDPAVQQEIVNLKAKNVYAVGALSADTVASLKAISGVNVTALQGADRTETAAKVAAQLTNIKGSFVVAYNGVADAMSAASYAAANGYSILVENPDATLPANEAQYKGAKQYTVGGQAKLDGATALSGADRYATNDAVVKGLDYKYDTVYVANGESLVDALAGAPLAAKTNSAIVLANATQAATGVNGKVTDSTAVIALGGVGAVPEAVRTSVGHQAPTGGPVSVQSVAAASATSITVQFSAAPADISKVTFNVTNTGAPVTVTATWDSTKTVATLTGAANFAEGTYTVDVQNGTTDLGSSTVSITQQKIAKINITSTKLAVTQPSNVTTTGGIGYATFTVFDQYGNDITGSYLANNITWTTGVGSITVPSSGVLQVTPNANTNILTFSTVVITGYDSSSGVSTSGTLNTSTAAGTLSSMTLNKLTSSNNAILKAGDTSDIWYVDYSAKDLSGNDTKDYNLVKNGLITTTTDLKLSSSNPYVTAKVVQDPNDSNKAAIQVTVSSDSIQMDMPVTITAMTYGGAPSALNLTLKKQASVNTFTIMAPSYSIASGEYKQIPFVAYDQDGNQMTKYSDLSGVVLSPAQTLSNGSYTGVGARLVQNPDGTASLWYQAAVNNTNQSQPGIITASVPQTGKVSTITVNVQTPVKANTLSLDSTVLTSTLQQGGAVQRIDFGYNYGGLSVNDQYGRSMDFTALTQYGDGGAAYDATNNPNDKFQVVASTAALTTGSALTLDQLNVGQTATASGVARVVINGKDATGHGGQGLQIRSLAPGQQTVTFSLYNVRQTASDGVTLLTDPTNPDYTKLNPIDTKTVTFSVLNNNDIKGYAIDTVANPIYTQTLATTTGAITKRDQDFEANPKVWGTTAAGGKVVLAQGAITGVYVDSTDFVADTARVGKITAALSNYDSVFVAAKQIDVSKTGSSTNLTVTILGADGLVHPVTTTITSSSTTPATKSAGMFVNTTVPGISLSSDNTTATVSLAEFTSGDFAVGKYLTRFINPAESTGANSRASAPIYFYGKDSYGTRGLDLASVSLVGNQLAADGTKVLDATSDQNHAKFNIDQYGQITTNSNVGHGDYFTVTAITKSGLVQTLKIVIQ